MLSLYCLGCLIPYSSRWKKILVEKSNERGRELISVAVNDSSVLLSQGIYTDLCLTPAQVHAGVRGAALLCHKEAQNNRRWQELWHKS